MAIELPCMIFVTVCKLAPSKALEISIDFKPDRWLDGKRK
jgi:hypothetical protein